jgi:hypothetical protein
MVVVKRSNDYIHRWNSNQYCQACVQELCVRTDEVENQISMAPPKIDVVGISDSTALGTKDNDTSQWLSLGTLCANNTVSTNSNPQR